MGQIHLYFPKSFFLKANRLENIPLNSKRKEDVIQEYYLYIQKYIIQIEDK